jgi:peptide/nickel transport system permease protein
MATLFDKSNIQHRLKRWGKTWKIYSRNWMGLTGLIILSFIVILAILGPSITGYGSHQRTQDIFKPPGRRITTVRQVTHGEGYVSMDLNGYKITKVNVIRWHILGTNRFGEDVFTILLVGLRISLLVGIIAGSLTVIVGTTIGVASAYIGGWVDIIIMRITDVILVLPALPLMLLLASIAPLITQGGQFIIPQWLIIAFVYVIVFWPVSTRLIRSQALSLKQRAFVVSAKSAGAGNGYIIFKHLLPNVFPLMLTMVITSMRQAILYEAFLSFLGLGDVLTWSLGMMLSVAQNQASLATGAWWMYLPPGIMIGLITLSFAFIGIAFDEIVNPRFRKR